MTPSPIHVFVRVRIFGDFFNLTPASDGQNFYPTNFLSHVNEYKHRGYGDLYHMGENLFLQYKDSWGWAKFLSSENFRLYGTPCTRRLDK